MNGLMWLSFLLPKQRTYPWVIKHACGEDIHLGPLYFPITSAGVTRMRDWDIIVVGKVKYERGKCTLTVLCA